MRRILFVDDEQLVLDGLQNLLRKERKNWDMVFAVGGQRALEELAKQRFDVVITDMRMPNMDGAALLARVKAISPSTARIVLTGQSERDLVVRAMPVAHQFMDKPCDAERLRAVIERACGLQSLLHDPKIRDVIGSIENLPSVPEIYWDLTNALGRESTGAQEIAAIIETDPAMCIKLLQIVNSAYFGLAQRANSVRQAVSYLGAELIRALVLSTGIFSTDESQPIPGFSVESLQKSSLLTARMCKLFISDPEGSQAAFTAGLLHDVGKILLAKSVPAQMTEVIQVAKATGQEMYLLEQERLGVSHAEVGAYLLGIWGIQLPVIEAVAYHHAPSQLVGSDNIALAAVHVADRLIDTSCRMAGPERVAGIDLAYLRRIGVAGELPRWKALATEFLEHSGGGPEHG